MTTFKKSIFVKQPQQEVFDFLSNPANDVQWRKSAVSGQWISEPPIEVGSTQRAVDKFLGRQLETTSVVTVWNPPHQFSLKSVGGSFSFEFDMKLEPKEGGTELTIDGTAEFSGLFKLASGLVTKKMRNEIENDLKSLKLFLERVEV